MLRASAYRGLNFRDPFGLCPWCIGAGVGALLGGGGKAVFNYMNERPLTEGVLPFAAAGALAGATLGLGSQALVGAGAAAAPLAANIDKLAGQAQAAGPRLAQQIQAAGRLVGDLKLGQAGAVDALGRTLARLGAEYGQASINGVHYVTAAMAKNGAVNAIGVNANGSTFNATLKLGEKGLEVMK